MEGLQTMTQVSKYSQKFHIKNVETIKSKETGDECWQSGESEKRSRKDSQQHYLATIAKMNRIGGDSRRVTIIGTKIDQSWYG